MDKTLQCRIRAQLEQNAGQRALAHVDAEGCFAWKTAGDVHRWASGYASHLTELGLRAGDVCVLALQSDEDCMGTLMASLMLGAKPLLIAPPTIHVKKGFSNLARVLGHVVAKVEPRVVIGPTEIADMQPELQRAHGGARFVFGTDDLAGPGPTDPIEIHSTAPADTAVLQLTSGTTGLPRVCAWTQTNVIASLEGMQVSMDLRDDDICLNWTPLYHDMGLVNNFLLCFTSGVPLAMLDPIDFVRNPVLWLRALHATGATQTWSPNFGFALTADKARAEDLVGVDLSGVRAFWNAAERIHHETMEAFAERFAEIGVAPEALKTNFGCAENVGGATFSDPHGRYLVETVDRRRLYEDGIAEPTEDATRSVPIVGCGRPWPGLTIHILDEDRQPLPDGHVGDIALDTPSRMIGYHGDPEQTATALHNGWVITGDLAYQRDGELFWVGRSRERIAYFGKKLDPSDFERALLGIQELRPSCFAVFGIDDHALGTERVVLAAELRKGSSADPEDVLDAMRAAVYQELGVKLDDILLVPTGTLTKTSSGKRRNRHFRELYLAGELEPLRIG